MSEQEEAKDKGPTIVVNQIPDNLKEFPPVDPIQTLDKQMQAFLDDIALLTEGRRKDFSFATDSRVKLPVVPEISNLATYIIDRNAYLENLIKIDLVKRQKTFSEAASKEISNKWQIERELTDKVLINNLMAFFKEILNRLLMENNILLSRCARFCRTSADIAKYGPLFRKRQQELKDYYAEYLQRYERFYTLELSHKIHATARMDAEQEQRYLDERNGLAVLKIAQEKKNASNEQPEEVPDVKKSHVQELFGPPDLTSKPYKVTDLALYLRWLITESQANSDLDLYLPKTIILAEKPHLLETYLHLENLQAGEEITSDANYFDGLSTFIETLPVRPAKLEDFFVEFDELVNFWNVETLIGQEDGRPFAYEIDRIFMDSFYDQCAELTMVPYDGIITEDNPSEGIGGFSGNIGLDTSIATMATISGVAAKSIAKGKMPRLKMNDWSHLPALSPELTEIQTKNRTLISSLVEIDMELKLEYDILRLSDHEQVAIHLKESARYVWTKAATVPNSRPLTTKISIIPQNKDTKLEADTFEVRYPKPFDLGFKIPSVDNEHENENILSEKRLAFGLILQSNEETRKLEIEIANVDPTKPFDQSSYIVPTIASVFAEHEMLAFFQLRYVKIRDFRIKILRQLNFFRSIERRVVYEMANAETHDNPAAKNEFVSSLADMSVKLEFFDLNLKGAAEKGKAETTFEDLRTVMNQKVYVTDRRGTNIIYDLEDFDQEMLKILTCYINSDSQGPLDMEYLDELRFRTTNRRNDLQNLSFRNPEADRSNMLLEYYQSYHDYNNYKMQLVNSYMEVMEHAVGFQNLRNVAQIVTSVLHQKPVFNFEDKCFIKSMIQSKHSLMLHSKLIDSVLKHEIEKHRKWAKRFQPQTFVKPTEEKPKTMEEKLQADLLLSKNNSLFNSSLKLGLPDSVPDNYPKLTMHQPGVSVAATEIIPGLCNITKIWDAFQTLTNETIAFISQVNSKSECRVPIAECVLIKYMSVYWESFADMHTPIIPKQNTLLNVDSQFLNPYIPDIILSEVYIPFDQSNEGNFKSLGVKLEPMHFYNDPGFNDDGIEALYKLLKALLLCSRITVAWWKTELSRKIFESQLTSLHIKKNTFSARYPPLKFESGGMSIPVDEEREDDHEHDNKENATEAGEDHSHFKCGNLAMADIDENIIYSEHRHIEGVIALLKKDGLLRLKQILKVQLLEEFWCIAASELTSVITGEVYVKHCKRDTFASNESVSFDGFDLAPIIPTIVTQRKHIRKIMLTEFTRLYKNLVNDDMTDSERELKTRHLKGQVVDFYYNNMFQVITQELEKAEFAKFMSSFRLALDKTSYAPLIFDLSKVSSHNINANASKADLHPEPKSFLKQLCVTQGLTITGENGIVDRLPRLWHIPHVSEIIVGMQQSNRVVIKGTGELNTLVFKNNQNFLKALKVQNLIKEIHEYTAFMANVLLFNKRFAATIAEVRVADYVVNVMSQIKRDLLLQGENADYSRALKALQLRWNFWAAKWKLCLYTCKNATVYNFLAKDTVILQNLYEKTLYKPKSKQIGDNGKFGKPLKQKNYTIKICTNNMPTFYLFCFLSPRAKRLCDFRIAEIEEELEEYNNYIQSESKDDVKQRMKIEYVVGLIRTLRLKDEYNFITTGKGLPYMNEKERDSFNHKYKMRIVTAAIRAYHKGGSKGGLSTDTLLKNTNLFGSTEELFDPFCHDNEFNRVGKAFFDKQIQISLQEELLRDFTSKRVSQAKDLMEKLTDERLGRFFRTSDNATVNSVTGLRDFAFRVSEQDYNLKSDIFNDFLSELYQISSDFCMAQKSQQRGRKASVTGVNMATRNDPNEQQNMIFDDRRIFACKKTDLGEAILKFALKLNGWKEDRVADHERFFAALNAHIIEMVRDCEKIILQQAQDKREIAQNFQRDCRLMAHGLALDAYSAMASMETELFEARKARKSEEKKIRAKILDEYDSLVGELVREISILRNRFHEYQISNFNEMLNIITESKKEQLLKMEIDQSLTEDMRNAVSSIIAHSNEVSELRKQNYELKMTVLKIRSMFTMREQGSKSFYQSKVRKLSEFNKETEIRLWDSFRDSEARERGLRKALAILQKTKSTVDIQNDLLTRQLQAEQERPRLNDLQAKSKAGPTPKKTKKNSESEIKTKRPTDGINVEKLLQELANKTALIEELLQEKRDKEREKLERKKTDDSLRVKTARITGRRSKSPSAYRVAEAAEPTNYHLEARMITQERVDELELENRALRRKLFLNGIALPQESKKSLANTSTRLSNYNSSGANTPSRSRPRTANSRNTAHTLYSSDTERLHSAGTHVGDISLPAIGNSNRPAGSASSKKVGFTTTLTSGP